MVRPVVRCGPALTLLLSLPALVACAPGSETVDGPSLRRLDGSSIGLNEAEAQVAALMEKADVAGLSVAVIAGDEVAYAHAFGARDAASGVQPDERTVFAGASFSKPLFAYLVVQLARDGVLDLDQPLWEVFGRPLPDLDGYEDLAGDDRWRSITARRVLSHTTGLPNWRFLNDDGRLSYWFEPGKRFSYSGEGIALLQKAVEHVTGAGLEELAQDRVFGPLGMSRSSYVWQDEWEADHAVPHDQWGRPRPLRKRTEADAAGSLYTTAHDYARYVLALLADESADGGLAAMMLEPQVQITSRRMFGPRAREDTDANDRIHLAWSLGWGRFDTPYGRAFFHTGHDTGWQNYTVTYADARLGLVMLSNSDAFESIAQELAETLIGDRSSPFEWLGYERFAPGRKGRPPATPAPVDVPLELLESLAGSYRFRDELLHVAVREGRLWLRSGKEEAWTPLVPISTTEFLIEGHSERLAFESGPTETVTRMLILVDGLRLPAERVVAEE